MVVGRSEAHERALVDGNVRKGGGDLEGFICRAIVVEEHLGESRNGTKHLLEVLGAVFCQDGDADHSSDLTASITLCTCPSTLTGRSTQQTMPSRSIRKVV